MNDARFTRTLPRYLSLACLRAVIPHRDKRSAMLGAIGVRCDGVVVSARNGSVIVDRYSNNRHPSCHAEMRLLNKMDIGGVVYVARVLANGKIGSVVFTPREEPPDMGTEFIGWVDWDKVLEFAEKEIDTVKRELAYSKTIGRIQGLQVK